MGLFNKIKKKTWNKFVNLLKPTKFYPFIYTSYYHYKFSKQHSQEFYSKNFYTAIPNQGAGIGHQLANWIAGYWFAKYFNLNFAHTPFFPTEWDLFLGFGESEVKVTELINQKGYKKILLPLFDENNIKEIELIRKIIQSYTNQKIIFQAEQDQFYKDQFGVMDDMKKKFYSASARKNDKLVYSHDHYNIAVHIRRGDITSGFTNKNPNLLMRWQNNDYFINVIENALKKFAPIKPVYIYIFSQSSKVQMPEFNKFPNVEFCYKMDAQSSFLHMVYADLLITSKSSFSYKPALINNNNKICPRNFWHGYPENSGFYLTNESGNILN